ncbi:MAG: MFS transporter [Firmicutes bacterium]|jgi:MFS family permease|nr:MFS transporter [Bacillota bacterium]
MDNQVTPFRRLVSALTISSLGVYMAVLVPQILLLTLRLRVVDPQHFAAIFGQIVGLGALFAIVANPVAGAIADRTQSRMGHRRPWMLLGAIFLAAGLIAIGITTSVLLIELLWFLVQVASNFVFATIPALIADQVEVTRRGTISGPIGMAALVAILLGEGLINLLAHQPQMVQWTVMAVVALVTSVVAVLLIRERPWVRVKTSHERFSIWNVVPNPRQNPNFAWAWVARFAVMVGFASTLYNSVFLTQRFHYNATELIHRSLELTLAQTILTVISSILGGIISDRVRKQKPFVIISGVIVGLGLVVLVTASSFPILLAAYALMGLGFGSYYAVDTALVTRVLPRAVDAGKDLGVINIANALPQFIAPSLATFAIGVGGYSLFYLGAAAVAIVGSFAILPIPELNKVLGSSDPVGQESVEGPASL